MANLKKIECDAKHAVIRTHVTKCTDGSASCKEEYERDLQLMAEEYEHRNDAGECCVHIRKKHPSNRGLRALKEITRGGKVYSVN